MWVTKVFKTKEKKDKWVRKNGHRYQMQEVFINNAYGLDVRRLRVL